MGYDAVWDAAPAEMPESLPPLLSIALRASSSQVRKFGHPLWPRDDVVHLRCFVRHPLPTVAATIAIPLEHLDPQPARSKPTTSRRTDFRDSRAHFSIASDYAFLVLDLSRIVLPAPSTRARRIELQLLSSLHGGPFASLWVRPPIGRENDRVINLTCPIFRLARRWGGPLAETGLALKRQASLLPAGRGRGGPAPLPRFLHACPMPLVATLGQFRKAPNS